MKLKNSRPHHDHIRQKKHAQEQDFEIRPFPLDKSPNGFSVDTHEVVSYGTYLSCSKVK
ncbi:hypothetical protein [Leptospira weilii]|uniref:hypothetical protein n=1 Tax=Leptospira weilii TaxID=28184 RepID=UPI000A54A402